MPIFGMPLSWIGMILIIISWIIQLDKVKKGRRDIQTQFLIFQMIGILLLAIDGFAGGAIFLAILNLLSAAGAWMVWRKVKK